MFFSERHQQPALEHMNPSGTPAVPGEPVDARPVVGRVPSEDGKMLAGGAGQFRRDQCRHRRRFGIAGVGKPNASSGLSNRLAIIWGDGGKNQPPPSPNGCWVAGVSS